VCVCVFLTAALYCIRMDVCVCVLLTAALYCRRMDVCDADSCPDNLLMLNMKEKSCKYFTTIHLSDTIEVVKRKGRERLTILSIVARTCNKNEEHQGAKMMLNLRLDRRIRLGKSLKRLRDEAETGLSRRNW
jgi:hypothetical protein